MTKTDKNIIYFHLTMAGLIGGLIVFSLGLSLGAVFNNDIFNWLAIGIGFSLVICGGIFSRKS